MRNYMIKRFVLIIPTLFIITLVLFIAYRSVPGNVVDLLVQQHGTELEGTPGTLEAREEMIELLGLDEPPHIAYFKWVWGIISGGDFGESLWTGVPMMEEFKRRIPVSFELSIMGMFIGALLQPMMGLYCALRQDSVGDYAIRVWSVLTMAIPGFWIATIILTYPAIWWNWTPPIEYIPFTRDPLGNLAQFALPSVIMGIFGGGGGVRMIRAYFLEVMRQDYIRTAYSKGLSELVVVFRHGFRNVMIPFISSIGAFLPSLISSSVIVEQIFSLPGMGRYLLQAATQRDYNVICGATLVFSLYTLVVIVVTDLAYAVVDPRIRYR